MQQVGLIGKKQAEVIQLNIKNVIQNWDKWTKKKAWVVSRGLTENETFQMQFVGQIGKGCQVLKWKQ